jgi:NAD(P)-dependent dehydrogenase (short-subunit alcohol dehydrogenase family)
VSKLKGKVAIVTGATSWMGWGISELFAREGAAIVAGGRNVERGRTLVERICAAGGRAHFVAGDVGTLEGNRALVSTAVERFGGLDTVVMSAGELGLGSITDVDIETWHNTIGCTRYSIFAVWRSPK